MSKTIRRKNAKTLNIVKGQSRRYVYIRTGWPYQFSGVSYLAAWHFHGDGYNKSSLKKTVKWHTNWQRRADERKMITELKKDIEADCYDRKKKYLGIIWDYD